MKPKHIPNLICVIRIILVAPIIWSLIDGRYGLALALTLVAGLSDALDGYLARRFDWKSWLGGLLDPAADKLLMFSLFVTLTCLGWVPAWFTAIVIGRDLVIIAGTIAYKVLVGPLEGNPTLVSKTNTVLQILYALFTITHAWKGWPPLVGLQALGGLVLVTIGISVVQYMAAGFADLRQKRGDPS